jgi:phosphoribosylformimino-5-aminoimidazole carboxamide ribotide isomerase
LACQLKAAGLSWLIYTDVACDGMNRGLNLSATIEMAEQSGLKVVASGGANAIEDVLAARQAGLAGVIVGRALYDGRIQSQDLFRRRT